VQSLAKDSRRLEIVRAGRLERLHPVLGQPGPQRLRARELVRLPGAVTAEQGRQQVQPVGTVAGPEVAHLTIVTT